MQRRHTLTTIVHTHQAALRQAFISLSLSLSRRTTKQRQVAPPFYQRFSQLRTTTAAVSSGFTIVELLIVIVIIAILATITTVAYNGMQNRAATTTLQSDLHNAATQLALKQAQDGTYPAGSTIPTDLKTSQGTTFQYTSDGTTYCLTATSSRSGISAYSVSNAGTVKDGACTGHSGGSGSGSVALTCPTGYIVVPGSSTYGTSDFCVMKYEAKNVSGTATSQASGTPWVSISQTDAISTAQAACSGCHLITEAEWMTLAQNVLKVPSNWSGGAMGNGYIYSGHNDNSPANAIVASTNDNDGYNGTGNTSGNQRRTLTLTNGEVIWDMAGNVLEWTSGQMTGGQPGAAGYAWREWTAVSGGSFTVNPYPSSTGLSGAGSWTSANGIGQIYSASSEAAVRGFIRGGSWSYGALAGVLALYLSHAPSYAGSDLGFRVAR